MGTKIGKLITESRQEIEIRDLTGKKIGFDAYNVIYAFLARIRDQSTGGNYFTDSEGNVTSHLTGIFYRMTNLLANNIKPAFIFDGKPPSFKTQEIELRKKKKEEAKLKQAEAIAKGDMISAMKYAQATSRITPNMIDDAKRLLSYFGIPIVQATAEAEAQAAILINQGKIHSVTSQDYDSFLFGSREVIRNLAITQRRKVPNQQRWIEAHPEQILLEDLLSELKFKNRDQLIMLGLLIGTDYNPDGIKGVGPITALKLVHKYTSPAALFEYLDIKYKNEEIFPYPPKTLLDYFRTPEVDKNVKITHSKINPNKIEEFLVEERDFQSNRVKRQLNMLKRKSSQNTLDKFFG
ncbi:MAG: flap endonuclease-1 [Candidatus Hodarchaeales archaeon]|jgi:flap endonuclease-1